MSDAVRTVTVNFEGTVDGLSSAAARANSVVSSLFVSIGNVGKKLALLGVLGGVAPLLESIGAGLKAMAGIFLILPAMIATLVSIFKVAETAFSGFSAAANATSPEAFVAATRNMAPAMQQAVLAVREMEPNFIQLREIIQQNFWTGFTTDLGRLAQTYFPVLNSGLGSISTSLHGLAQNLLNALLKPQTVTMFTTFLANVAKMLTNMSGSFGNFLTGFLKLISDGSSFLPRFGSWMEKISTEFENWTTAGSATGSTITTLKNAFTAFHDFGIVLENIFDTIGAILGDLAGTAGKSGLSTLVAITGAVLAFVRSTTVAGPLSTIGTALRDIGLILVTVVQRGLVALGPIFAALSPIVVALAGDFGTVLLSAFTQLAPPLTALITALGPVLIPLLNDIATILSTVIIPILSELIGWITDAVNALGSLFGGLTNTVGAASNLTGGGSSTSSTSSGGGFFSNLVSGVGSFFSSLFGGLALGGPALAGQSYLVGENGPEILSMGNNGFVTPLGGGGDTHVHVKIGETELRGMVTAVVRDTNQGVARAVRQGRGLTAR